MSKDLEKIYEEAIENDKPYFAAHFAEYNNLGQDRVKGAAARAIAEEFRDENYETGKEIGRKFGLEEDKIDSIFHGQFLEEELL